MRNGSETSRRGGTGRRAGLKIQYSQECVGSNPSAGIAFAVRRRKSECRSTKSETNTKCQKEEKFETTFPVCSFENSNLFRISSFDIRVFRSKTSTRASRVPFDYSLAVPTK